MMRMLSIDKEIVSISTNISFVAWNFSIDNVESKIIIVNDI